MIYAVLSDIHADVEALREAMDDARVRGAEKIICLGDVVGYGPAPAETLALVREVADVALMGNHDAAACGLLATTDFNPLAANTIVRHRMALASADLATLTTLPYVYEGCDFIAAHGDFTDPRSFLYLDTPEAAAENFAVTDSPLLFVGHTHVPLVARSSDPPVLLPPQDFTLQPGSRYLVNPGSISLPRQHNAPRSYVLFDSTSKTITYRFMPQRGGRGAPALPTRHRGTLGDRPLPGHRVALGDHPLPTEHRGALGDRPRPRAWGAIVLMVTIGLMAVIGIGWGIHQVRKVEAGKVEVEKVVVESVEVRRLALSSNDACVIPNVRLKKGSCPVLLKIAFLAPDGATNDVTNVIVKRVNEKRRYRVPKNSSMAVFTIEAAREHALASRGEAKIETFAPRVEQKK